MKKVVVFGGSGFLGSHVADHLTHSGYDVVIYDARPSEYLKSNQKMVVGDLLDNELVSKTIKGSSIVYNFAALSDLNENDFCTAHTFFSTTNFSPFDAHVLTKLSSYA